MAITRLALNRRSVTFLATALLAVAGILSIRQLKSEFLPDMSIPVVTVVTQYPAASPESVATQVSEPIESIIAGLQGLDRLESTSAEGISLIQAEFDFGTDMERAEQDVSAGIAGLGLPDGVRAPLVRRIRFEDFPIVVLSVFGDREAEDLQQIVTNQVIPVLQRVDGVFEVSVLGLSTERAVVKLDPQSLGEQRLTLDQVMRALSQGSLASPSGFILQDDLVLPVRTLYRYSSVEAVEAVAVPSIAAVSPEAAVNVTAISELGTVEVEPSPRFTITRTNGRPSLRIQVFKSADANTVNTANAVEDELRTLEDRLPGDVQVVTLYDQSEFIEESINGLVREGVFGALFAVIVIAIFLTSGRATLVTAVSIPLSILTALLVMAWQGITLNIFTLGGLTIAIGRVVDDSIVVLENIYVHMGRGKRPLQAAMEGTAEVSTAIFSSTLTTVAVFLPLAFVGGLVGEVFLPFALTVTIALLASLVVALTVVPALATVVVVVRGHAAEADRETWLQRLYTPILRWCLARRAVTLVGAAGLFVASFGFVPFIAFTFISGAGPKVLDARVELPPGTKLSTTDELARAAEAELAQVEGLETSQVTVGLGDPRSLGAFRGGVLGTNVAEFFLVFEDGTDLETVREQVRDLLTRLPGEKSVSVENIQAHFESDRVDITVGGANFDDVRVVNDELLTGLNELDGIQNLETDIAEERPEVQVQVEPSRAAAFGLAPSQVSQQVRTALFGIPVAQIEVDGEPLELVVRLDVALPGDAAALAALPLSAPGSPRLEDVAQVVTTEAPVSITRVDQQRAATITGTITSNNLRAVSSDVDSVIDSVEKPAGVEVQVGGTFEEQEEAFSQLYVAMAIGVLIVYLVMVASLGSILNPLIILFSLPFISIGSLAALFITGRALGLPALIGLLMLIGIVVTNAIVFVTFIEQQRAQGLSIPEALLRSGRSRVRPILMTALATIFALVPMSLGFTEGLLIASELATVVIGGLFTSTVLTLVVIPVIYSLVRREGRPEEPTGMTGS